MKFKLKMPRFHRLKIPLDVDDALIIVGSGLFTYGLWGYDPRMALMILGIWLVILGRAKGGDN